MQRHEGHDTRECPECGHRVYLVERTCPSCHADLAHPHHLRRVPIVLDVALGIGVLYALVLVGPWLFAHRGGIARITPARIIALLPVAGMLVASVWGWRALGPGGRMPLHLGPGGWGMFVPRSVGL